MSKLVSAQQNAVSALKKTFHDVEFAFDGGTLFATFTNGQDSILIKECYHVSIGTGGRICFIGANRYDTNEDLKHRRVLAKLASYELVDKGYSSVVVRLR